MKKLALTLVILLGVLAYAQTDSLPACEATLRSYSAEFDALMYSGMTPVVGHPETLVRTAPASEFSLSYLIVAHDGCTRVRGATAYGKALPLGRS